MVFASAANVIAWLAKRVPGIRESKENGGDNSNNEDCAFTHIHIYYGSQTGRCKRYAHQLAATPQFSSKCTVHNLSEFEPERLLKPTAIPTHLHLFIMSTYQDGTAPDNAKWFFSWLEDFRYDFRVEKDWLSGMRYAVFGAGNSVYGSLNYNRVAKQVDLWLNGLAAKRIWPLTLADEDLQDVDQVFEQWCHAIVDQAEFVLPVGDQGVRLNSDGQIIPISEEMNDYYNNNNNNNGDDNNNNNNGDDDNDGSGDEELLDVEDLGRVASKLKLATEERASVSNEELLVVAKRSSIGNSTSSTSGISSSNNNNSSNSSNNDDVEKRPMLSPSVQKTLTKQGYKIIGTHSGVKVCRWTKAMLRGRGGCYKHTFYGIASHQCMETTPSLACANKCTFCWRHNQHPTGTQWKWKIDPPEMILDGAMQGHYQMIKQLRGVPGVQPERFQEGFNIRHCALSLVGEPIFYPHINEFLDLLHQRRISSFLVTNAQFPDQLASLRPITQLYLSIDATNKESLRQIDRPLFSDYWPRFLRCLDELARKGQRTVYRLTLVKEYNTEDVEGYVQLIRRGRPDFIEIKGVTYCGFGDNSPLTMRNVPYQHEVISFATALMDRLSSVVDQESQLEYGLACEHEHSCSILIADKRKFFRGGHWHTWIDYDRFHDLVASGEEFTSLDYMAPTPAWAVYGAAEKGFDPAEKRHYRNKD